LHFGLEPKYNNTEPKLLVAAQSFNKDAGPPVITDAHHGTLPYCGHIAMNGQ